MAGYREASFLMKLVVAMMTVVMTSTAHATWSIQIADTKTKEVAVGTVTCLQDFDLLAIVPVVVVGKGVAGVQSAGDFAGIRRPIIFSNLKAGVPVENIFALVAQVTGHQDRQYGIVDTQGGRVTFSGSLNSAWAGGVTGTVGSMVYSIQGNIMTGPCVVAAIEQAVLTTVGDMPAKLMAGMQAASAMGGDGRCSCTTGSATSCGCPPANFTKPGHIGGMVVARIGDTDDPFCNAAGCADGDYFMRLDVPFQTPADPNPVDQLQILFDAWRATLSGRPDAVHSTVVFDPPGPAATGAPVTMTITLADWQGQPVAPSIQSITVQHAPGSAGASTIGSVVDLGGGSFSVSITPEAITPVADRFRITIDDGVRPVTLMPDPSLDILGPVPTDDCAVAPAITEGVFAFDTVAATTDGPAEPACAFPGDAQLSGDVWACYSPTVSGQVTASLCGSDFDTRMAVYNGCQCPTTAAAIACNDDACGGTPQSETSFNVTAGQDYLIRIGGFATASGTGSLTITRHAGACCLPDATCADLPASDCLTANGTPRSEGTSCVDTICSAPARPESIAIAGGGVAVSTKNRFLSFSVDAPGQALAIRVTFTDLPAPFDLWNGAALWVGAPREVSEISSETTPSPGSGSFQAAALQCLGPVFMDWSTVGVVHVFHEGIVPGGSYLVETVNILSPLSGSDFSPPLSMSTAKFGDTVLNLAFSPPGPPEGAVNIDDALAVLARFANVPGAITKPRADLEPACLDLKVNVSDVLSSLAGFSGLLYPFVPPGPSACDSSCPSVLP